MRVIYNRFIPFKGFAAINLFGIIFARHEFNPISWVVKNHEAIHTAQGREMLWLPFYLWYVLEWIFRLFQYRFNQMKAYENISFEREAFANDKKPNYLQNRSFWSWINYLRVK